MHSAKSKWRPIALLAPIAVIVVALALFLGGSGGNVGHQEASAVTSNSTGIFNVTVTLSPPFAPEEFRCILGLFQGPLVTGVAPLNGKVVCYTDTPSLGSLPPAGSAVPTFADGISGAPPPPPYGSGPPNTVGGSYDKATDISTTLSCFPDVGATLGPHLIARATVNATANTGTVALLTGETLANCQAATPVGSIGFFTRLGFPLAVPTIALVQKTNTFDSDGDGCTDAQELGIDLSDGSTDAVDRPTNCGDDPFNPFDSDNNIQSVQSINVIVAAEDRDIAAGEDGSGVPATCYDTIDNGSDGDIDGVNITAVPNDCLTVPGAYFQCQAATQHIKTGVNAGDLKTRLYCYVDNPLILVNAAAAGVLNCVTNPELCGDGSSGTPPPLPFGDLDLTHSQIAGSVTGNVATLAGCIADVDGVLGPNVWVETFFNIRTGIGEADIWPARADCTDANPDDNDTTAPLPLFPDATLEIVEQKPLDKANSTNDWDTDQDGCSDTNELGTDQLKGGLRDPYNTYDLFDPNRDGAVAFADFLLVLQHFNTNDQQAGAIDKGTPPVDPSTITGIGVYSPRYDRGGQISGSNGWNEDFPDGSTSFGDFLSLLRQFGHTCNGHVDPFL